MDGFLVSLRAILVLGPIVGLLVLGLIITLRSGVVNLSQRKDLRLMAGNLSGMLIRLAGYLAGMAAVERLIGFHSGAGW